MGINFEKIVSKVPVINEFLTPEELNDHASDFAFRYPGLAKDRVIGQSKEGKDIHCLQIGAGKKSALLYGTPHPNEPIGCMVVDSFCNIFLRNPELLEDFDFTWYLIPTVDIDGLDKNLGWLKGPFTITNYQKHFFRPAFDQQVEWSFPIEYKEYKFQRPTPETQSLMKLIEEIKPDFIYSLHNSGFGGAYWYITDGDDVLYEALHEVAKKNSIPLSLGDPEMPYCKEFAPAVYQMTGFKDRYDFMETQVPKGEVTKYLSGGGCSFEYTEVISKSNVHMLIAEIPYFCCAEIENSEMSSEKRIDVLIEGLSSYLDDQKFVLPIYEQVQQLFSRSNQFFLATEERMNSISEMEVRIANLKSQKKDESLATRSQVFDSIFCLKFYSNLTLSLFRRACEEEISRNPNLLESDKEKLEKAKTEVGVKEDKNLAYLEKNINYSAIPIQSLVKHQMECGLRYAAHIQSL